MSESDSRPNSPIVQAMEPGVYWWCACGHSLTLPFCDGAHKGRGVAPIKVVLEESKTVAWCACGKTGGGGLCDGSHQNL